MRKLLLSAILILPGCSAGHVYSTHPAEQGIFDFIIQEAYTVARTGSLDPDLNNRTIDSGFGIARSEYWRVRAEREIEQRERERLDRLERERYFYRR